MRFDRLVSRFQAADRNTRLETLLDFSKKLPPLPELYQAELAAGASRITECQTPVYLGSSGRTADCGSTQRSPASHRRCGATSLCCSATLDGATPAVVAEVPDDLLGQRLRLLETLGMMRGQGLTAILSRLKRLATGEK